MKKIEPTQQSNVTDEALRRRELQEGLSSGVSERTPQQIRVAFRKTREA